MSRALLFIAFFFCVALPAQAQLCEGVASFGRGSYQLLASTGFNTDAVVFTGGLGIGGRGIFGQLLLGTTSFKGEAGSAFNIGGRVGYQATMDPEKRFHMCPVLHVGHASGPNNQDVFGDGSVILDVSATDYGFALEFGALASTSKQLQVVPAGSLAYVHGTVKLRDVMSGASASGSDDFGLLTLGVGLVFQSAYTLRTGIAIPLAFEGASKMYSIGVGVNFRQAARR